LRADIKKEADKEVSGLEEEKPGFIDPV